MSYDNNTPVTFISPITITTAMVTSSNAVANLPGELSWSSTTNYAKGTVVTRTFNNVIRRYENQIPGTNSNAPETDQDRWYDLGSTDKMSMFDNLVHTQSIAPNSLVTVFKPGSFDSFYLANLEGRSLTVLIKDAPDGATIFNQTFSLDDSSPADYYEYFFSPFRPQTDFIIGGLVPYANSEVTLTVANAGGVSRIGIASFGSMVSLLAPPESGSQVKVKNYTRTETDSRGVTDYKRGRKARDLSFTITVEIEQASNLADSMDAVSDTPVAVIGGDIDYLRALRTFGLLNYEMKFRNDDAVININVQGTI